MLSTLHLGCRRPYVRLKRLTETEISSLTASEHRTSKRALVGDVMMSTKRPRQQLGVTECSENSFGTEERKQDTLIQKTYQGNELNITNKVAGSCRQHSSSDGKSVVGIAHDVNENLSNRSNIDDRNLEFYLTGEVPTEKAVASRVARSDSVTSSTCEDSEPCDSQRDVDYIPDDLSNCGSTISGNERSVGSVDLTNPIVIIPKEDSVDNTDLDTSEATSNHVVVGDHLNTSSVEPNNILPAYHVENSQNRSPVPKNLVKHTTCKVSRVQLDHPPPRNMVVIADTSANKVVEYMRSIENLCNQPSPSSKTKPTVRNRACSNRDIGKCEDKSPTGQSPQDITRKSDIGYSRDTGQSTGNPGATVYHKSHDVGPVDQPVPTPVSKKPTEEKPMVNAARSGRGSRNGQTKAKTSYRSKMPENPPENFKVFNVPKISMGSCKDTTVDTVAESQYYTESKFDSTISKPNAASAVQASNNTPPEPITKVNTPNPALLNEANPKHEDVQTVTKRPQNSTKNFEQFHVKQKEGKMPGHVSSSAAVPAHKTAYVPRGSPDPAKRSPVTSKPVNHRVHVAKPSNHRPTTDDQDVTMTTNSVIRLVKPVTFAASTNGGSPRSVSKQQLVTMATSPEGNGTSNEKLLPMGKFYVRRGMDMQYVLRETNFTTVRPTKNKDNKYECPECERACVSIQGLDVHFRSAHDQNQMPHHCDMCGRGFFSYGTKVSHLFNEHRLRQVDEFIRLSESDPGKT